MGDTLTQLGVGGIFAIVIIRSVFDFIKSRGGDTSANGAKPVSRAEFETHKQSVQYKDSCVQIVKRLDAAQKSQEMLSADQKKDMKDRFDRVDGDLSSIKASLARIQT